MRTLEQPWICFMDGASIHTYVETRNEIREKYPWLIVAFTPAGTTYCTQPLDRSVMRSFKASIARRVSEYFAWHVIDLTESELTLELDVRMSVLKPLVLQWVAAAIGDISNRPDIFLSAWREIVIKDICYFKVCVCVRL